jgi:hypothetical protein
MLSFCYIVFRQHKIVSFKTGDHLQHDYTDHRARIGRDPKPRYGRCIFNFSLKGKNEMHVCVFGTSQIHKSHHFLDISHTAAHIRDNMGSHFSFVCHSCCYVSVPSFQSDEMHSVVHYFPTFEVECYVFSWVIFLVGILWPLRLQGPNCSLFSLYI